MKGFTRDHKFVPMTDYKKVIRKSRDPEVKTQGIKIERKARTVTLPKLHREKIQEDGLVKFWSESSDGKTVASLIQSKDFEDEMEIRITLPNFEKITVRGSKDIMDELSFDEFLDKVNMHMEREEMMRKKREVTRKGRFDEQRSHEPKFVIVKRTLPSKLKLKKELVQVAQTDNLSEAFRFLRQQEGDYIIDNETGNTINRSLQKREPFQVGERRPKGLGDEDIVEALQSKKELTRADLIGMQRQPRKKGDLSEEDFKRRQEIVRKLEDLKHNRDKIAVRKINPDNTSQFNKKSRALGKANDKLNRQREIYKKEFGLKESEIQW